MSWFAVADKLSNTQCFERNKTGRCNCVTKRSKKHKGKNPCDYAQKMIDACGNGFVTAGPDEVLKYLETKRCRNKQCNHKHCAITDNLVEWVVEHLRTMKIAA